MGTARNLIARGLRKAARLAEPPELIDISDEYVNWLCYANAGMLYRGNLYCFDYAISHLVGAAPILEIGSFCGLSTNLLTYYKRKRHVKNPLITCDKWDFQNTGNPVYVGDSPILRSDYKRFVRDTYLRNVRMFSGDDLPFTFEMTSDEFFADWRHNRSATDVLGRTLTLGGPLSFCYVDGNHTYECVKRDFINCDAFLEVGGFVLFDDSVDPGVGDLMPEVFASGRYKLAAKNPNHLFQKVEK
jgi:hypothetical protein